MVLRRCAWHGLYHGYRVLYGVASWRGAGISFTDGLCKRCALILSRDLRGRGIESRLQARLGQRVVLEPALAALGLLAVVAVIVAARPFVFVDLEMPSVGPAHAVVVEPPAPPAPPEQAVVVHPPPEALRRLFTAKVDLEATEAASPETARAIQPTRAEPPYIPWVARPRGITPTVMVAEATLPPLPSRALLTPFVDPAPPRALASLQAP